MQRHRSSGQVFALFVIAIAAAEVGVGLAIVLLIYRNRRSIDLDDVDRDEGLSAPMCVPRARVADPAHPGGLVLADHLLRQAPAVRRASEIGIAALGASFVLSLVHRVQWIQRVEDAERTAEEGLLAAFGRDERGRCRSAERPSIDRPVVAPIIKSVNWFDSAA